ncbi:MAG: tetrahydrofolate dehydrogenase/cyclohydrolase catalytic domain-containing protein, partial [Solirubrobacterales bacterium]
MRQTLPAKTIDGKQVSQLVRDRVAVEVADFVAGGGHVPTLATVLVGADPASEIYVANKHKACEAAGMRSVHHGLPADIPQAELVELVKSLGQDDGVDGILVQLPLP